MVVKKKREHLQVKSKTNMGNKGFSPDNFVRVVNPKDFNDLALLFHDMDMILNSPIEKAYKKYKQGRGDFPFY